MHQIMMLTVFAPGNNSFTIQNLNPHEQLEMKAIEYTDYSIHDKEKDIDLDTFFFSPSATTAALILRNGIIIIRPQGKLSLIHMNSRSLSTHFQNIKEYLDNFAHPFNIIAISEIWSNMEKGVDFEIDGYLLNYVHRKTRAVEE